MDLTKISAKDFKTIARLLEKKEGLLREVAAIDSELRDPNTTGETTPKTQAPRTPKRGPRGALKDKIVGELKSAGKRGVAITDLKKIGVKYRNASVWFYTTGSKIKEIKKVGPARYAWVG